MQYLKYVFSLAFALLSIAGSAQVDLDNGLIIHYPFNGNSNDFSGNTHHAVLHGPILTNNHLDQENAAYHFDGNDDYISIWTRKECNNNINTDMGATSIWFNAEAPIPGFLYEYNSDHNDRLYLLVHDDGRIRIGISEKQFILKDTIECLPDYWYHFVINWYNDGTLKVYINGEFSEELETYTPGYSFQGDEIFSLGRGWSLNEIYFQGSISTFRLYGRTLNEAEVCALYFEGRYSDER